ncbi:MAG: histidine phosphatase family protein [Salinibacterium sp.]|nr:histidine phosphatase family protein [Salinibacterium sp.]
MKGRAPLTATTQVILVRHGETDWNREGRFLGRSDIPMNKEGERQAEAIARALLLVGFSHVYASPLQRAYRTATTIAEVSRVGGVVLDHRWNERDYGPLEGLTFDDAEKRFPRPRSGVESRASVQLRTGEALAAIRDAHTHQTVVVVTHGTVMHVLAESISGKGQARPANGSTLTLLSTAGGWRLDSQQEVS